MDPLLDFRDALPADAGIVTRHRFAGTGGPDAERAAFEAWVRARLAAASYLGRLACVDGEVVAGAGVMLLDWGPTRGNLGGICGRIVAVSTDPPWRRRGIASALVRQVMGMAAALGVCDFRLAASAEGAGVYRRLGFKTYEAEMILKVPA